MGAVVRRARVCFTLKHPGAVVNARNRQKLRWELKNPAKN
jgi:hypothetical protein